MKKWIALAVLVVALLSAYVAAGPYLAIRGIRSALAEQDVGKLSRYVDYPAIRAGLRAQVEDWLARKAGDDVQSSLLGSFALSLADGIAGRGVDTAVTPLGVAAALQGRSLWKRATGATVDGDRYGKPVPADPLKGAQTHYESTSRFTATIRDDAGKPVVFVFTRHGLRWKLTGIRFRMQ